MGVGFRHEYLIKEEIVECLDLTLRPLEYYVTIEMVNSKSLSNSH
jgi:hypothetical protein